MQGQGRGEGRRGRGRPRRVGIPEPPVEEVQPQQEGMEVEQEQQAQSGAAGPQMAGQDIRGEVPPAWMRQGTQGRGRGGGRRGRPRRVPIAEPPAEEVPDPQGDYMEVEQELPAQSDVAGPQVAGPGPRGEVPPTAVVDLVREMMGLIQEQRQQQTHAPPPPAPESGRGLLDEIRRPAPKPFEGATDPHAAELWVRELEKTFDLCQASEEDRVRTAAFLLQGGAENWYLGEVRLREGVPFQTWEEFREAFFTKYMSQGQLLQMEQQFIHLTQGDRTVEQYEAEFDRLARFVPDLVTTERSRVRRFEAGLRPALKKIVAGFMCTTYSEVVARAKYIDASSQTDPQGPPQKEKGKDQGQSNNQGQASGKSSGKPKYGHKFQPYGKPTGSAATSGDGVSSGSVFQPIRCFECGGPHKKAQCPRITGGCFACGSLEHRIAQCPRVQTRQGTDGGAQGTQKSSVASQQTGAPMQGQQGSDLRSTGAQRPKTHGRVYHLVAEEAQALPMIAEGSAEGLEE